MPVVIPCGVALIRRNRDFLIAQRRENDSFGLLWEFPGGKKNRDESFEECVAREVLEEIGIDVQVHEKLMEVRHPYRERVVWLNFFLCTHRNGQPQAVDCENIAWVDVEDLKNYPFPPANEAVIQKLKELVG